MEQKGKLICMWASLKVAVQAAAWKFTQRSISMSNGQSGQALSTSGQ